jgi:hypothetical protein
LFPHGDIVQCPHPLPRVNGETEGIKKKKKKKKKKKEKKKKKKKKKKKSTVSEQVTVRQHRLKQEQKVVLN